MTSVYIDASYKKSENRIQGAVIYNDEVYCFSRTADRDGDSNIAEMLTFEYFANEVLPMIGHGKILVYTDSNKLVETYKSLLSNPKAKGTGRTIKAIRAICTRVIKITSKYDIDLIHIPRSSNKAADYYSKLHIGI